MLAPKELRDLDQWICWRWVKDKHKEKMQKIPVNLDGIKISVVDRNNFSTYDDALEASLLNEKLAGIGFVFTPEDDIVGIDIDGKDIYSKEVAHVVKDFASYTEVSPSGKGLHIFVKGKLPGDGKGYAKKSIGYELYQQGRFFTFTHQKYNGTPNKILSRQRQLDYWRNTWFTDDQTTKSDSVVDSGVTEWDGNYRTLNDLGVRVPAHTADTIKNIDKSSDRSTEAFHVVSELKALGCDDQQILGVLLNPDYAISGLAGDRSNGPKWLARYILKPAQAKHVNTVEALFTDALPLPPSEKILDLIRASLMASIYPRPNLAIASVLSALSTIIAGVFSYEGVKSNLYVVSHSPTGGGKQHYLNTAEAILTRAGFESRIGASEYASAVALESMLEKEPDLLVMIDEFGKIIGHSKKDTWANTTRTMLLKLYSSAMGVYRGSSAFNRDKGKHTVINYPCVSVFGTTTLETLTEAVTTADLFDGFLNRFIVIDSGELPKPTRDPLTLEQAMNEKVYWLTAFEFFTGALPTTAREHPIEVTSSAKVSEFFYRVLVEQTEIRSGRTPRPYPELYGRLAENCKKLSLIVAAIENPDEPVITMPVAKWSYKFLLETIKRFAQVADENFIDTDDNRDVIIVEKALRRLHDDHALYSQFDADRHLARRGWCTRSRVLKATKLTSRRFEEAIRTCLEKQTVSAGKEMSGGKRSKEVLVFQLAKGGK